MKEEVTINKLVFNDFEVLMIKLNIKDFNQVTDVLAHVMGLIIQSKIIFANYREEFLKLDMPIETEGYDYFIIKNI